MLEQQWIFQDKSTWGDGPWQSEPDKMQWTDLATGLPCLIVRNHFGALCGYVGVSREHPAYGKEFDKVDAEVHGGLTFANRCSPSEAVDAICHIPAPGEPDDVWWFGFDASHAFDLSPAMASMMAEIRRKMPAFEDGYDDRYRVEYRPLQYVKDECAALALQLSGNAWKRDESDD
jgi:hypothetical protein